MRELLREARSDRDWLALPIVNSDTRKVLAIAESFDNPLKFFIRAFFEVRLNVFREALRQYLGSTLEFSSLTTDFGTDLEI
jgi:hypothetical protein